LFDKESGDLLEELRQNQQVRTALVKALKLGGKAAQAVGATSKHTQITAK